MRVHDLTDPIALIGRQIEPFQHHRPQGAWAARAAAPRTAGSAPPRPASASSAVRPLRAKILVARPGHEQREGRRADAESNSPECLSHLSLLPKRANVCRLRV